MCLGSLRSMRGGAALALLHSRRVGPPGHPWLRCSGLPWFAGVHPQNVCVCLLVSAALFFPLFLLPFGSLFFRFFFRWLSLLRFFCSLLRFFFRLALSPSLFLLLALPVAFFPFCPSPFAVLSLAGRVRSSSSFLVPEELPEVATHGLRRRLVRRAEVDQQHADACGRAVGVVGIAEVVGHRRSESGSR